MIDDDPIEGDGHTVVEVDGTHRNDWDTPDERKSGLQLLERETVRH